MNDSLCKIKIKTSKPEVTSSQKNLKNNTRKFNTKNFLEEKVHEKNVHELLLMFLR